MRLLTAGESAESISARAPETIIARDLARRAAIAAPLFLVVSAAFWGFAGAASAGYALVIVAANFLVAAALVSTAARISPVLLMAAVLGGYVLRLALITIAVLAVTGTSWFEPIPLGFTLVVAHLGLLVWESRRVSASLAYPVLKPRVPSDPSSSPKEQPSS